MRQFAEHGFRGAHVEDIAHDVGVAKGTVFLDFGSKEGLFLAAYQRAVRMLPAWLDAPEERRRAGVLGDAGLVARSAPRSSRRPIRCRTGSRRSGGTTPGLGLRQPIDRFMRSEDPYGTLEFVEFGVQRGEVRDDIDPEMIASMLDWLAEKFQDALVSEDLDPGLIHRRPERRGMRIKEFVEILRDGIYGRGDRNERRVLDRSTTTRRATGQPRDALAGGARFVRARRARGDRPRLRAPGSTRSRCSSAAGGCSRSDASRRGIDRLRARVTRPSCARPTVGSSRRWKRSSSRPPTSSGPGYSLFFCHPDRFRRRVGADPGERSPRREVRGAAPGRSRHVGARTTTSLRSPMPRREALFDGWTVERFEEEENDGEACSGPKHWHVFHAWRSAPRPDADGSARARLAGVSLSTSVFRPAILRVAHHPWVRRVATGDAPRVGRVAGRFVAGETLAEAMAVGARAAVDDGLAVDARPPRARTSRRRSTRSRRGRPTSRALEAIARRRAIWTRRSR